MRLLRKHRFTKNLVCFGNLFLAYAVSAQTTNRPVILSTSADSAGAIGITWQSESNLIYRIEYAAVASRPMGWQPLYEDYPSQGTNTIWKDAGSELSAPAIPHPNDTDKRFYRVVVSGTNSISQPQVGIVSPAAASVLSDYVTVSVAVTSSLTVASLRLFVDGQETGSQFYPATNFVINTAQFGNGPHNLFVVAENLDGAETTLEAANSVDNFAVSPYLGVTFDNYISDFRASARFLEPADGETMRFKANFAAYSDWILTISNSSAVTVRTATGSGYNMMFLWDGTDNGGNSISADFYSATLSAVLSTNVPAPDPESPDSA
jgi:hypothetical protein